MMACPPTSKVPPLKPWMTRKATSRSRRVLRAARAQARPIANVAPTTTLRGLKRLNSQAALMNPISLNAV
ncbi:hypothetical protein D3C81_2014250 [compost metagenome]